MAKITSNEYVKVAWILDGSMTAAQAAHPNTTILTAGVQLSPAIAWQDFELNASDSDDVEDRGITDPGNAVTRGFANFGGTISFFRDANLSDSTSDYNTAWSTFKTARTYGYLVIRVATRKWDEAWTAGDRVSVYRMVADIVVDDTEGDDSVKFTVSFLPQGLLYTYIPVEAASPAALAGVPSTNTLTIGSYKVLAPTLSSTDVRSTATYVSSDTTKLTVSANGVIKGIAAGTPTVTVTHASATAPVVQTVTVS